MTLIDKDLALRLLHQAAKIDPRCKRVTIRLSGFDTRDLIENQEAWTEPTATELLEQKVKALESEVTGLKSKLNRSYVTYDPTRETAWDALNRARRAGRRDTDLFMAEILWPRK